jgi:heavy metal efflux system protein
VRFPTFYGMQRTTLRTKEQLASSVVEQTELRLRKEVTNAYQTILFWRYMVKNYEHLDSIYKRFSEAASRRLEAGESNSLEALTAQTKQKEIEIQLTQSRLNAERAELQLNKWIQSDTLYTAASDDLQPMLISELDTLSNPSFKYLELSHLLAEQTLKLNKQAMLPDLKFGIFQGTNNGTGTTRYMGVQAGLAIPLFFGADKARIAASKTEISIRQNEYDDYRLRFLADYQSLLADAATYLEGVQYYKDFGAKLNQETLITATKAYEAGEIDFLQYALLLENATKIQTTYLHNLYFYNITVTEANYLLN